MRYTEEERQWLRENYPKLGERETARQFNERFNHSQKAHSLATYCSSHLGVSVSAEVRSMNSSRNHNHGYLNVNGRRFYEPEEIEWLKENYEKLGAKETCRRFNELFDHNKSSVAISAYCRNYLGLSISKEKWLELKSVPIGYKYKNKRGDWYIKTESGWELLTHTIKEVPKGHIAFFLDGNHDNTDPENIAVVRNGIHTIAQNYGLVSENPTITSVGLTWSELYSELKKKGGKKFGTNIGELL